MIASKPSQYPHMTAYGLDWAVTAAVTKAVTVTKQLSKRFDYGRSTMSVGSMPWYTGLVTLMTLKGIKCNIPDYSVQSSWCTFQKSV